MTPQQFDIVTLRRWVGGPAGHEEELGTVAFLGDEVVWVDGSVERRIREDLGVHWTRRGFARRYRADRTAVAYGDCYLVPHASLGWQIAAWMRDAHRRSTDDLNPNDDFLCVLPATESPWPDAHRVEFGSAS
jgi:hypothetical protein